MQPPRKTAPEVTLGQDSRHAPSTRHPDAPADTAIDGPVGGAALAGTRDAALIRGWAEYHGAEPATGEATASGPATVSVNDQGSGLRFNFPGAARFREVTWDEWLGHFVTAGLVFVFEAPRPAADGAPARFGGAFYRVVSAVDWDDRPLAILTLHDPDPPQNSIE